MTNYTLTAMAVATLFAGSVNAVDFDLSNTVARTCEVTSSGLTTASGSDTLSGILVTCNDVDGANITLTSSEGGLENSDDEDVVVGYTATLAMANYSDLLLDLSSNGTYGFNDTAVTGFYASSAAMAGGLAATLDIVVTGSTIWAGYYTDQLTLTISSI